ncbi:hypothetical protein PV328_008401 [Microctonus aethiopoides]|uniref:Uncharacterized protein n=1 Tax=Microctonus aethiopoides TaxID=144406 RepID=A0AA39FJ58_9HYME|nr:hypothetical protein PV328_008401 [Microctonus aethiopoides]
MKIVNSLRKNKEANNPATNNIERVKSNLIEGSRIVELAKHVALWTNKYLGLIQESLIMNAETTRIQMQQKSHPNNQSIQLSINPNINYTWQSILRKAAKTFNPDPIIRSTANNKQSRITTIQ